MKKVVSAIVSLLVGLVLLFVLIPRFGTSKDLRRSCWVNQRVLTFAVEQFQKEVGLAPLPFDARTGDLYQDLLIKQGGLKTRISQFPECLYRCYQVSSGSVQVFCLACGFEKQTQPAIKEEFIERLKMVASPSAILNIDFSLRTDCSQLSVAEFRRRVLPWRKLLFSGLR